ncbi:hypothetical protein [Dactylosporangium sp. CA-233914]|uniref:hypothetical protein n=1 Tax=Dactylosporangium sp. CA-233914 TaxID=3239934 RepID=UPI003D8D63C6
MPREADAHPYLKALQDAWERNDPQFAASFRNDRAAAPQKSWTAASSLQLVVVMTQVLAVVCGWDDAVAIAGPLTPATAMRPSPTAYSTGEPKADQR